jgi:hypothetical protein
VTVTRIAEAWRAWVGLLARREPPEALAAIRIVIGATVLLTLAHAWWSGAATALWVSPDQGGIGPNEPGLMRLLGGATPANVRAFLALGIGASTLLTLGRFTRASAIVAWLVFRTLAFANPMSGGSGDDVVANVLLFVVLADSGKGWSLDARRLPPRTAVLAWPRYVAIGQLVAIYTSAGWHKMSASWMPLGSLDAVWYSVQNPLWQRWPVPASTILGRLAQAATLATWLFEVSSPLLLLAFWFRATSARPGRVRAWFNRHDARAKYLLVGLCIHLGIELTMEVGAFFGGMMALYAACVHPNEWRALAARVTSAKTG